MKDRFHLAQIAPKDWPTTSGAFRDLTYEQSATYAHAAAARIGAEAQYIAILDEAEQPVAAACLRIKRLPGLGRGITWIPGGPLIQRRGQPDLGPEELRAVLGGLREHARQTGNIMRLRFSALTGNDALMLTQIADQEGFEPTDRATSYRTVVVDCEQSEDMLMRTLHGKWRNPLRNALKAELKLEQTAISQGAARFEALYDEVQAKKGFNPDIPPSFYYSLNEPDFSHELLFARKDGADIAAMMIGRAGETAVYLYGATSDTGRLVNAGHYLMWQAILYCKRRGLKNFDLGGIDAGMNPSVTRFKLRTGGVETAAPGPFEFRPAGIVSSLIGTAETVHTLLKARR